MVELARGSKIQHTMPQLLRLGCKNAWRASSGPIAHKKVFFHKQVDTEHAGRQMEFGPAEHHRMFVLSETVLLSVCLVLLPN
jgi:hypothetical protein